MTPFPQVGNGVFFTLHEPDHPTCMPEQNVEIMRIFACNRI